MLLKIKPRSGNSTFFAVLLSLMMSQTLEAQNPPRGQDLFDHMKDLLVRVKAADSVSSPKASYGTGFVIDPSGIIATNYHVISNYVMQPGNQWKIIVETQDLQNIEAELIDLSVVDDLAIIRVNKKFPSAIKFEPKKSSKGERSFSLGLPNDINMSLIEGVYNGVLDHGPYSLVHVTTPLNGGMSGGPTVNSAGRLIGINVARILFANDISFIVPVERLVTLVKRSDFKRAVLTKKEAQDKIYEQLEAAQNRLYNALSEKNSQKVEFWQGKEIQLPDFLKCWSGGTEDPQLPYVLKTRSCRLDHAVYLANSLDTGALSLQVKVLDSSTINRTSTKELMRIEGGAESLLSRFQGEKFFGDIDAREIFTPYKCEQTFLKSKFLGEEKTLRSGVCIRKYKNAKDLYDFSLSWYDFKGPLKTQVSVSHSGVNLENSQKLLKYWMGRFQ